MKTKKILILLPDGVGLRNFAFTSFVQLGEQMEWDVIFWNQTPFDLSALGYKEIKQEIKPRAFTDLLKRAKINSELNIFQKKFKDPVYETYKFPAANTGVKQKLKNLLVALLSKQYRGDKGLRKLRERLKNSERKSGFYKKCKETLQKERPDFVFCTNQRPVNAIAPLTAAEDLGIKTGTFIFSWDNLPKATMIVEPQFYFVWSQFMKQELLQYYPYIDPNKIFITGTPQFEAHFDPGLRKSRQEFFLEHDLDLHRDYICFSGDDESTSPYDPIYLEHVVKAVEKLNKMNYNLGIIFRRCPTDFSHRYNRVLDKYNHLIISITPAWDRIGENWNTILPKKEDLALQVNTLLHCKAVINLGSSMVFDAVTHDKPCLYLNYDISHEEKNWSVQKIYKFVHFRSMPSKNVVLWLNSADEIEEKLQSALNDPEKTVQYAQKWFRKIQKHPPQDSSERIWIEMNKL